ncbi:MAG: acyl carrier protein [Candidatus Daviesbacteria bacterium]|nr:acyl carrier protein [Candidatus Daviesbacteria bacterium]
MLDQKKITEAIADNLGLPPADIDAESHLQDDLGLNAVEIADLLGDLADKFQIAFHPSEPAQVKTVGDLIELVEDKLLE